MTPTGAAAARLAVGAHLAARHRDRRGHRRARRRARDRPDPLGRRPRAPGSTAGQARRRGPDQRRQRPPGARPGPAKRRCCGVVRRAVRRARARPARSSPTTRSCARALVAGRPRATVLAGQSVSDSRTVGGQARLRRGPPGRLAAAIVLRAGARPTRPPAASAAIRRTLLAIADRRRPSPALLGVLFARRIARPLRRTAAAAHALAGGRRDVVVPADRAGRGRRGRRGGEHAGRRAVALRGPPARVPDVGVARPAHPADRDHRLRRVAGRRRRAARAGRRGRRR